MGSDLNVFIQYHPTLTSEVSAPVSVPMVIFFIICIESLCFLIKYSKNLKKSIKTPLNLQIDVILIQNLLLF